MASTMPNEEVPQRAADATSPLPPSNTNTRTTTAGNKITNGTKSRSGTTATTTTTASLAKQLNIDPSFKNLTTSQLLLSSQFKSIVAAQRQRREQQRSELSQQRSVSHRPQRGGGGGSGSGGGGGVAGGSSTAPFVNQSSATCDRVSSGNDDNSNKDHPQRQDAMDSGRIIDNNTMSRRTVLGGGGGEGGGDRCGRTAAVDDVVQSPTPCAAQTMAGGEGGEGDAAFFAAGDHTKEDDGVVQEDNKESPPPQPFASSEDDGESHSPSPHSQGGRGDRGQQQQHSSGSRRRKRRSPAAKARALVREIFEEVRNDVVSNEMKGKDHRYHDRYKNDVRVRTLTAVPLEDEPSDSDDDAPSFPPSSSSPAAAKDPGADDRDGGDEDEGHRGYSSADYKEAVADEEAALERKMEAAQRKLVEVRRKKKGLTAMAKKEKSYEERRGLVKNLSPPRSRSGQQRDTEEEEGGRLKKRGASSSKKNKKVALGDRRTSMNMSANAEAAAKVYASRNGSAFLRPLPRKVPDAHLIALKTQKGSGGGAAVEEEKKALKTAGSDDFLRVAASDKQKAQQQLRRERAAAAAEVEALSSDLAAGGEVMPPAAAALPSNATYRMVRNAHHAARQLLRNNRPFRFTVDQLESIIPTQVRPLLGEGSVGLGEKEEQMTAAMVQKGGGGRGTSPTSSATQRRVGTPTAYFENSCAPPPSTTTTASSSKQHQGRNAHKHNLLRNDTQDANAVTNADADPIASGDPLWSVFPSVMSYQHHTAEEDRTTSLRLSYLFLEGCLLLNTARVVGPNVERVVRDMKQHVGPAMSAFEESIVAGARGRVGGALSSNGNNRASTTGASSSSSPPPPRTRHGMLIDYSASSLVFEAPTYTPIACGVLSPATHNTPKGSVIHYLVVRKTRGGLTAADGGGGKDNRPRRAVSSSSPSKRALPPPRSASAGANNIHQQQSPPQQRTLSASTYYVMLHWTVNLNIFIDDRGVASNGSQQQPPPAATTTTSDDKGSGIAPLAAEGPSFDEQRTIPTAPLGTTKAVAHAVVVEAATLVAPIIREELLKAIGLTEEEAAVVFDASPTSSPTSSDVTPSPSSPPPPLPPPPTARTIVCGHGAAGALAVAVSALLAPEPKKQQPQKESSKKMQQQQQQQPFVVGGANEMQQSAADDLKPPSSHEKHEHDHDASLLNTSAATREDEDDDKDASATSRQGSVFVPAGDANAPSEEVAPKRPYPKPSSSPSSKKKSKHLPPPPSGPIQVCCVIALGAPQIFPTINDKRKALGRIGAYHRTQHRHPRPNAALMCHFALPLDPLIQQPISYMGGGSGIGLGIITPGTDFVPFHIQQELQTLVAANLAATGLAGLFEPRLLPCHEADINDAALDEVDAAFSEQGGAMGLSGTQQGSFSGTFDEELAMLVRRKQLHELHLAALQQALDKSAADRERAREARREQRRLEREQAARQKVLDGLVAEQKRKEREALEEAKRTEAAATGREYIPSPHSTSPRGDVGVQQAAPRTAQQKEEGEGVHPPPLPSPSPAEGTTQSQEGTGAADGQQQNEGGDGADAVIGGNGDDAARRPSVALSACTSAAEEDSRGHYHDGEFKDGAEAEVTGAAAAADAPDYDATQNLLLPIIHSTEAECYKISTLKAYTLCLLEVAKAVVAWLGSSTAAAASGVTLFSASVNNNTHSSAWGRPPSPSMDRPPSGRAALSSRPPTGGSNAGGGGSRSKNIVADSNAPPATTTTAIATGNTTTELSSAFRRFMYTASAMQQETVYFPILAPTALPLITNVGPLSQDAIDAMPPAFRQFLACPFMLPLQRLYSPTLMAMERLAITFPSTAERVDATCTAAETAVDFYHATAQQAAAEDKRRRAEERAHRSTSTTAAMSSQSPTKVRSESPLLSRSANAEEGGSPANIVTIISPRGVEAAGGGEGGGKKVTTNASAKLRGGGAVPATPPPPTTADAAQTPTAATPTQQQQHRFSPMLVRCLLSVLPPSTALVKALEDASEAEEHRRRMQYVDPDAFTRSVVDMTQTQRALELCYVHNSKAITLASLIALIRYAVTLNNNAYEPSKALRGMGMGGGGGVSSGGGKEGGGGGRANSPQRISSSSLRRPGSQQRQRTAEQQQKQFEAATTAPFGIADGPAASSSSFLQLPYLSLADICSRLPTPPDNLTLMRPSSPRTGGAEGIASSSSSIIDPLHIPFINSTVLLKWAWEEYCSAGTGPRFIFLLLSLPEVGVRYGLPKGRAGEGGIMLSPRHTPPPPLSSSSSAVFGGVGSYYQSMQYSPPLELLAPSDPYHAFHAEHGCGYGPAWAHIEAIAARMEAEEKAKRKRDKRRRGGANAVAAIKRDDADAEDDDDDERPPTPPPSSVPRPNYLDLTTDDGFEFSYGSSANIKLTGDARGRVPPAAKAVDVMRMVCEKQTLLEVVQEGWKEGKRMRYNPSDKVMAKERKRKQSAAAVAAAGGVAMMPIQKPPLLPPMRPLIVSNLNSSGGGGGGGGRARSPSLSPAPPSNRGRSASFTAAAITAITEERRQSYNGRGDANDEDSPTTIRKQKEARSVLRANRGGGVRVALSQAAVSALKHLFHRHCTSKAPVSPIEPREGEEGVDCRAYSSATTTSELPMLAPPSMLIECVMSLATHTPMAGMDLALPTLDASSGVFFADILTSALALMEADVMAANRAARQRSLEHAHRPQQQGQGHRPHPSSVSPFPPARKAQKLDASSSKHPSSSASSINGKTSSSSSSSYCYGNPLRYFTFSGEMREEGFVAFWQYVLQLVAELSSGGDDGCGDEADGASLSTLIPSSLRQLLSYHGYGEYTLAFESIPLPPLQMGGAMSAEDAAALRTNTTIGGAGDGGGGGDSPFAFSRTATADRPATPLLAGGSRAHTPSRTSSVTAGRPPTATGRVGSGGGGGVGAGGGNSSRKKSSAAAEAEAEAYFRANRRLHRHMCLHWPFTACRCQERREEHTRMARREQKALRTLMEQMVLVDAAEGEGAFMAMLMRGGSREAEGKEGNTSSSGAAATTCGGNDDGVSTTSRSLVLPPISNNNDAMRHSAEGTHQEQPRQKKGFADEIRDIRSHSKAFGVLPPSLMKSKEREERDEGGDDQPHRSSSRKKVTSSKKNGGGGGGGDGGESTHATSNTINSHHVSRAKSPHSQHQSALSSSSPSSSFTLAPNTDPATGTFSASRQFRSVYGTRVPRLLNEQQRAYLGLPPVIPLALKELIERYEAEQQNMLEAEERRRERRVASEENSRNNATMSHQTAMVTADESSRKDKVTDKRGSAATIDGGADKERSNPLPAFPPTMTHRESSSRRQREREDGDDDDDVDYFDDTDDDGHGADDAYP